MGAGYVGMAFINEIKHSHEIYITTTTRSRVESLKPYAKEVFDLNHESNQSFDEFVNQCDGAVILVAPSNSRNYEETYLQTAKKLFTALSKRTTPFYMIYTSSTSVYEGQKSEWVSEEMELSLESINAKILLETEKCFLNCNACICILRLAGIFGPKRELNNRATKLSGKEMAGSGDEPTNHIHLDDILSAITFCLKNKITGIYNLVNEDHPTRESLYSNLCNQMKIPPPIWNMDKSQSVKGYKVSNQKIKHAGFAFQHGI